ncbi:putative DMT superfamily transporter inner membrane protein [mine drainage metagenome]|uniref:Putative DMT superfamily transporter inner membrane protein n=1 Tax=mine drainage metagenome TaxID=410659 RepID=A0A1J5RVZ3_9ZZZZ
MRTHTKLDFSTVLLLTLPPLLWAGNAVVGRLMVGQIPPLALSFDRWFFALLVALLFTGPALWRERAVLRRHWKPLACMGFVGVASYNSLQYVALHTTSPLNVSLITSAAPVFILLIGAVFYREPIGAGSWWGAALSVGGVIVVVTKGQLTHLLQLTLAPGDLLMLLAVFLWGFYTWELRRRPLGLSPFVSLSAQMAWGTLFIAPFAAYEHWVLGESTHWGAPVVLSIAYAAVLASLLAYVCWGTAVARTGAQIPAYFGNLAPVFAALLSYLFLHEGIALYHLFGAALIFAGIHVALRARPRIAAAH